MPEFNDRRIDSSFVYGLSGGRTINRQRVYQTMTLHVANCPSLRGKASYPLMQHEVADHARKGLAEEHQHAVCKRCKPHETLQAEGRL